jgi:hypothetical protein
LIASVIPNVNERMDITARYANLTCDLASRLAGIVISVAFLEHQKIFRLRFVRKMSLHIVKSENEP